MIALNIPDNLPIRLNNPRVWRTYIGGSLIDELHGSKEGKISQFPEEWIMSVVAARNAGREHITDEGMSYLYDSPSLSLKELLESNPEKYLGSRHAEKIGAVPGTLVKLIDSAERLTLQVHPDRQTAMRLFNSPFGKTECWHILGGREINGEKPCIYLGFQKGVTREIWKDLFDRQDISGMLQAMQRFDTKPGDTIMIEAGMPHAIGAGCFLVEIQEPTDFTIRVERKTPAGLNVADFMCHQGLGFDKMFDAFHYDYFSKEEIRLRWFIQQERIAEEKCGTVSTLIGRKNTPLFRLDEINVSGSLTIKDEECFSGLYVLDGKGKLETNGGTLRLEKTAQFFVPYRTGSLSITADSDAPLKILHFFGPEE